MPLTVPLPTDTATALGFDGGTPKFPRCDSRSLVLDRCADPRWKDSADRTPRRDFFREAMNKPALRHKADAWLQFLSQRLALNPDQLLFAQLQSRLMVNMAGGVMENAGLCLDRFGLPYIPGSAVKGCARRAALAALHEWCDTNIKPGATEGDKENVFKSACEPFTSPAAMLVAIARVFGWCEQDWSSARKDGRFISDFAWACDAAPSQPATHSSAPTGRQTPAQGNALGQSPPASTSPEGAQPPTHGAGWTTVRDTLVRRLAGELRLPIRPDDPAPWKSLPNFTGSVSFLSAYPVDLGQTGKVDDWLEVPPLGELELDVVTCHHRQYYDEPDRSKKPREWKEWNLRWGTAPDTEEPVPIIFPAVAPGHVLVFALVPLRNCAKDELEHARRWLADGLSIFGLGAKTNAGYGWFDASHAVQLCVGSFLRQAQEARSAKYAEVEQARRNAAAAVAAAKVEQDRLAKAPPQERFQAEYAKLGDESFATQAKKYAEMTDEQRHGFILALKNQKRETTKRWVKKKSELLKPWQDHAQKLQPSIQLP
jgi:CRISPR/Cas system CMR subunit Cmr6 (Cas7 group RAMP superfamily)